MRPDRRIPFNDDPGEPLALRLGRALESGGLEQRARLRNLGDFSLFMSGFFSDSLQPARRRRRLLRVDGGVRLRLAEPAGHGRLWRRLLRAGA